jgi:hypothetical protein
MSGEETLKLDIRPDGVETLEGGLDSYQEKQKENEEVEFEFTFEEKKKLLRAMGRKTLTDQEIETLSDDEIEEIKEFVKLRERKAIYKFVTRKKTVTDEDVINLTQEEVEDMIAKSYVMARHFSYNPKKNFGAEYKKERQRKNKQAKASRKANRK